MSMASNGVFFFFEWWIKNSLGYVLASLMTKSGIIKDERDTPHRRVRHQDGKLLRGGIGLTTRLGWSDRSVLLVFYI